MSAPYVEATRYTVSMWPPDSESIDRHVWDLSVEQRAPGRWAVYHLRRCLAADGTWSVEPIPSERTDEWKVRHRFDLGTALRLAREAAPHVVVNGLTAAECAEREMSRQVAP